MPTNTYVALDKVTVGTATSTITFSSIPQGYTDLVLVMNGNTDAATTTKLNVGNGTIDTGANYSWTVLSGTGGAANSYRESSVNFTQNERYANWDASNNANTIISLQNYSNATTNKTWLTRGNNAAAGVDAIVGMWRNTSAINIIRVSCTNAGRTFSVGSTFSLYGIKAQVTPGTAKATGGTITYDQSGNVIHTFTSSGTFTPSEALSCDYLVVAGAGGGGTNGAGGAGAGGYLTASGFSAASGTGYTVTIGAGGAGAGSATVSGTSGNNSVFSSITSTGGGGGGSAGGAGAGLNGGSGGGEGSSDSGFGLASPSGQGNNGGQWVGGSDSGAGGGGAGAAGANNSAVSGGAGGDGLYNPIRGTSDYYAGGGGGGGRGGSNPGGAGGIGGGGAGGNASGSAPTAGTANTGGGGGGGGYTASSGAAGGSGIVIIRYSGI
jgi:hypothetical protein